MAFNGAGVYNPLCSPDFPAVPDTTIRAAQYNNQINDIAAALTNCITRDGQSLPTQDLPMGGRKHTVVGAAALRTQYARAAEVQDRTYNHVTEVSGVNAIVGVVPLAMSAYTAGQIFTIPLVGANTSADMTVALNGLTATALLYKDGVKPFIREFSSGDMLTVLYTGTVFEILSSAKSVPVTGKTGSAQIPAGTTAQRDAAPAEGYIRYNQDLKSYEGYGNSAWGSLGGGAVGGGTDKVFYPSAQRILYSYKIPANTNVFTSGNLTTGQVLTIDSVVGNGTTLTLSTTAPHLCSVGDNFEVTGTTNFNGTFTVATTSSDTQLTALSVITAAAETTGNFEKEVVITFSDPVTSVWTHI